MISNSRFFVKFLWEGENIKIAFLRKIALFHEHSYVEAGGGGRPAICKEQKFLSFHRQDGKIGKEPSKS